MKTVCHWNNMCAICTHIRSLKLSFMTDCLNAKCLESSMHVSVERTTQEKVRVNRHEKCYQYTHTIVERKCRNSLFSNICLQVKQKLLWIFFHKVKRSQNDSCNFACLILQVVNVSVKSVCFFYVSNNDLFVVKVNS